MLCLKCGDHHEGVKCPPVEQACYLVDCKNCENNEHILPKDVVYMGLLNSDNCFCGRCGKANSFYVKEWTPFTIKKYNEEAKRNEARFESAFYEQWRRFAIKDMEFYLSEKTPPMWVIEMLNKNTWFSPQYERIIYGNDKPI